MDEKEMAAILSGGQSGGQATAGAGETAENSQSLLSGDTGPAGEKSQEPAANDNTKDIKAANDNTKDEKAANGARAVDSQGADQKTEGDKAEAEKAGNEAKAGKEDEGKKFDREAFRKHLESLDPELGLNIEAVASIADIADKAGLTADNAKALLGWAIEQAGEVKIQQARETRELLKKEFGGQYDQKLAAANALVGRIDKALDGKFRSIIEMSGLGANADFVRGMIMIGEELSEDSLGLSGRGANAAREETAYEALSKIFK